MMILNVWGLWSVNRANIYEKKQRINKFRAGWTLNHLFNKKVNLTRDNLGDTLYLKITLVSFGEWNIVGRFEFYWNNNSLRNRQKCIRLYDQSPNFVYKYSILYKPNWHMGTFVSIPL